jgi:predicted transposase/invertase (TIGR01784 family)
MKNQQRWCFLFKKMHKFAIEEELPKDLHGFGGVVDAALMECLSEDQTMEYEKAKAFEYERLLSQLYGEKKGREEARKEARADKEKTVLSLIDMGMSISDIAKATRLSTEEVESIKAKTS